MPTCVAFKCSNRSSNAKFFRFPFRDHYRLQQWVQNINRKDWAPNKYSRLCSYHFTLDCFIDRGDRVCLTRSAVPTIFNPYTGTTVSQQAKRSEETAHTHVPSFDIVNHDHAYMRCDDTVEPMVTEQIVHSCEPPEDHNYTKCDYNGDPVVTERNLPSSRAVPSNPEEQVLRAKTKMASWKKKIRVQEQRVRRLRRKVECLCSVNCELKRKLLAATRYGEMQESSFEGVAIAKEILTRAQSRVTSSRVSDDLRSFSMTLYSTSPKAYQFVRESFGSVLPHPQTVKSWKSRTPADPSATGSNSQAESHVREDPSSSPNTRPASEEPGSRSFCRTLCVPHGNRSDLFLQVRQDTNSSLNMFPALGVLGSSSYGTLAEKSLAANCYVIPVLKMA
ncbi:hypothetical protein ACEWY4_011706 [Coilia grayii]|uniref:THAP domain-containing protein 1 n=1 Tax=Coilia grayii TaxID=363190 RepID=A0ABD1JYV9_9TELE